MDDNKRQVEVLENGWRKITLPNGKVITVPPAPAPVVVPDPGAEPPAENVEG